MQTGTYLYMDPFTVRNLELVPEQPDQTHTLLTVIDRTVTPMGARMLRLWMLFPLQKQEEIQERLNAVEYLLKEPSRLELLQTALRSCGDLERLAGKMATGKIRPKELKQLATALKQAGYIKAIMAIGNPYMEKLSSILDPCTALADNILVHLQDNPLLQHPKEA